MTLMSPSHPNTNTIKSWPQSERPREKLLTQGAQSLSDAELLAIFLRTGIQGTSAVQMGRQLIQTFGSLAHLLEASIEDLQTIKGLGQAKAAQLLAVLELGRRYLATSLQQGQAIHSSEAAKTFVQSLLRGQQREQFLVLFLNQQHRLQHHEVLFEGTLNEARVYPREVVKMALKHHAAAVIIAHNHPSGIATPSQADHALTQRMKDALALVDVSLLDHFIVAGAYIHSFAESGELTG